MIIFCIIIFIFWYEILNSNNLISLKSKENIFLENMFIGVPFLVISAITVSSLALIYSENSSITNPDSTILIRGYQWGWSFKPVVYPLETYLNPDIDTEVKMISKFLNRTKYSSNVSEYINLKKFKNIKFEITSNDVIHSFWTPSLGFKIDAIPGTVNIYKIFCINSGNAISSCAELCGVNHWNMVIGITIKN